MSYLRMLDSKSWFFVAAILVLGIFYYLKDNELNEAVNKNTSLSKKLLEETLKSSKCSDKLKEQNEAIHTSKIEIAYKEPEIIEKIRNIYIRDDTCVAELSAYKELFANEK